jgi:hypothetical protein
MFLPVDRKRSASLYLSVCLFYAPFRSIRPFNAGGIAGGTKFLVNGIFFKVASDDHGLYGSYQYAQKSALLYAPV